jgi:DNA-binding NarL/FixJ family response regulator
MNPRGKMSGRKKIFIVDDHPMMREGLAQLIGNQPDLQVCGESGEAHDAPPELIRFAVRWAESQNPRA